MKPHTLFTRLVLAATLATFPLQAEANGIDLQNIALNLITSFAGPILITVAILAIVVAGFTLMLSEQEGALDKAKKTIIAVIIGGILATIMKFFPGSSMSGPMNVINLVYTGFAGTFLPNAGAVTLGLEAEGVAGWIAAMAVMIGIVIIIIAVIRAVGSFGGDEAAYTNVRTAVLHVIIGLILISGAYILRTVMFTNREPSALITFITSKIIILLGFILLIAVAILIYAGFRMVISFGSEEEYTAAKSLAFRVVVGIVVVIVSYTLVIVVSGIFG